MCAGLQSTISLSHFSPSYAAPTRCSGASSIDKATSFKLQTLCGHGIRETVTRQSSRDCEARICRYHGAVHGAGPTSCQEYSEHKSKIRPEGGRGAMCNLEGVEPGMALQEHRTRRKLLRYQGTAFVLHVSVEPSFFKKKETQATDQSDANHSCREKVEWLGLGASAVMVWQPGDGHAQNVLRASKACTCWTRLPRKLDLW